MTSKEVGVLSQRPTANLAEPTVRQQPSNQLTEEQLSLLMDSKLNEFDKTNFLDRKDQAQRNQPDLTGGASGSTIMGG